LGHERLFSVDIWLVIITLILKVAETNRILVVYMSRPHESKGVALGALLVIVMAVMVVLAIFFIIASQSGFLSSAAVYLGSLLVVKLP
jgi:hypothetical protein